MTYDAWKTRSPDDGLPQPIRCVRCNHPSRYTDEDDCGEYVCEPCMNRADTEAQMLKAIRAWMNQPKARRPSVWALGQMIEKYAEQFNDADEA